jgi:hypothetical protein
MRWVGAIAFPISVTLLAEYGVNPFTVLGVSLSLLLIISPYRLNKSLWFAQIKVKADMYLDTFSLRFYLADKERAKDLPIPEVQLICDIEFCLVYGEGAMKNQIGIQLPRDIKRDLANIVNWSRLASQDYPLTKTGEERIELKRGWQSFHIEKTLFLQVEPSQDIGSKLEEISEKLESGHFDIKWQTARDDKPKLYRAKRQRNEL